MSDATLKMQPTLWLSVIEICNRIMDTHLQLRQTHEYANKQFESGFNYEALKSDHKPEDDAPASGRKVKK